MLRIEHLTKRYKGGKTAVSDLSLHVRPGDIYGFIGRNGAGKTTTIKCVVGIHEFDAGEIRVDGLSVRKEALECKKRLAYLPDNPELYEYLTGIQAALKLKEKMKALCAEGSAVFFSTHVLDVAEKLCSRIAIISGGKLVLEGETGQVLGNRSLEQIFMEVAVNAQTDQTVNGD